MDSHDDGFWADLRAKQSQIIHAAVWPLAVLWALVVWLRPAVKRIYSRLVTNDLSPNTGSSVADCYAVLSFLATLAVTQSIAIVGAYQALANSTLILFLVLGMSLLTVWAILRVLRLPKSRTHATVHYYSRGTIHYAHWTLWWSVLLPVVITVLTYWGLLDFDTPRAPFEGKIDLEIPLLVNQIKADTESIVGTRLENFQVKNKEMLWGWLATGGAPSGGHLYLIMSRDEFYDDFLDVHAKLVLEERQDGSWRKVARRTKILNQIAFLFQEETSPSYSPNYRQAHFKLAGQNRLSDEFIIERPNEGERLLILVAYTELFDPAKHRITVEVQSGLGILGN